MTDVFFALVYLGGFIVAYRDALACEMHPVSAVISSLFWPLMLGATIVDLALRNDPDRRNRA